MGTVIDLDVCGLTLDWTKNGRGDDHGFLFQTDDRRLLPTEETDYDGQFSERPDPAEMEMGFSKSLGDMVPRLELLGFGMEYIEQEYRRVAETCREQRRSANSYGLGNTLDIMTFSEFKEFVVTYPISELDNRFKSLVAGDGDRSVMGRFSNIAARCRVPDAPYDAGSYSERSYFGNLIRILHPYSMLRLLADSDKNRSYHVTWRYGLLVDAGWASNAEFAPNARRLQTFLIVTEGSSDAYILKHAFSLIRPEVADFFRFVDMGEGHPFSGAGNLVRFARGLSKIYVHNQVVFLLDNDSEGVEARARLERFSLQPNMKVVMLPEDEELRGIRARGPDGAKTVDINRRAASIECYLDLKAPGLPEAEVVWTSYKKELDAYQGALKRKEAYTKAFLKLNSGLLRRREYDVRKISAVLDEILLSCGSMAADARCRSAITGVSQCT